MMRTFVLLVFLSSLLVSGCTQTVTAEPAQTPAPRSTPTSEALPESLSEWTIMMTHSGGIMGLSRSIEISSDGKFTVMDNRANKTVTGELAADDLSKLNELLMSIDNRAAGKPDGMVCADCFIYDLEVRANGQRSAVRLSDISLPNSGYEALIDQLRGMIDTALQ
ncbi:MAG: hypothetical protein HY865_12290 [Chloroflexi bacterium]|nr:hypothetical protein [Chloroflexota bacterium]